MSNAENTRYTHASLLNDRTTVVADSLCLIRDVHDLVHRSHKRFDGVACDERRTTHGSAAGRRRGGNFLLGLFAIANARRISGAALECETRGCHPAGRLGHMLGR